MGDPGAFTWPKISRQSEAGPVRKADALWNELQSIRDEETKQLHVDTYNPLVEQTLDRRYLRLGARAVIEILTKLEDMDTK